MKALSKICFGEGGARWVRVALFVPCYVDLINPEVGMSVARILRKLGIEVVYPEEQSCCGQPAFNSGFFDRAKGVARHFLEVFEKERWDYAVRPSGSCTTMVSHHSRSSSRTSQMSGSTPRPWGTASRSSRTS